MANTVELSMRSTTKLAAATLSAIAITIWHPNCFAQDSREDIPPTGNEVQLLDFGRPCKNPQPVLDQNNPADKLTRTPPRSDPAAPLTQPPYPAVARRLGQEGTAILLLLINESGEVSQAKLARSTKSSLLDAAALEQTRNWRLNPGTMNGKPICMWGRFAVAFKFVEYSVEELAGAAVSPEAERLASILLDIDRFEQQMADEAVTAAERTIVRAVKEAFVQESPWLDARRRVAAMLSIEFTALEIEELTRFQASPLAGKLRDLQYKLLDTVGVEERVATNSLLCTIAEIDRVLKDRNSADVFDGEKFKDRYAERVPEFISHAALYCHCKIQQLEDQARGFVSSSSSCGPQPELE